MEEHLSDEALNEFLDAALEPAPRAAASAHLAVCPECAGRLAALEVVLIRLAAMPEATLDHDLTGAVLRSPDLPAPLPVARPAARSRALQWLAFAQLLGAALLAAAAWPFAASQAHQLSRLAPTVSALLAQAAAAMQTVLAALPQPQAVGERTWVAVQAWLTQSLTGWDLAWPLPGVPVLPPLQTALALAAGGLVWLVGNALLLREPLAQLRRRRS